MRLQALLITLVIMITGHAGAGAYDPDNVGPDDLITGVYSITLEQTGAIPSIRVRSDGKTYTAVQPGQYIVWQAKSRGVCRSLRKIRKYSWWLNDNTQVKPISYYSHHKRLIEKHWITSKSKVDKYSAAGSLSLPVTTVLANAAVSSCNAYLNGELEKGTPLEKILAQDHTIHSLGIEDPKLSGVVFMQCSEDQGLNTMLAHAWQHVRINYICEAFDFPKPKPAATQALAMPFLLEQPLIKLVPDKYSGPCPVDIQVEGTIKANQGQQEVQYRWSHDGAMGPVASAMLNTSGWQTVKTVLKDIGKEKAEPGKTVTLPYQSKQAGHDIQMKAQPDNVHTGFLELKALPKGETDWNKARTSEKASYIITCRKPLQPAARLATPLPKPVNKSDLTHGPTLTLANATGPWGSVLAVDAGPFNSRKRGDRCELRMAYDVLNTGQLDVGSFLNRLFKSNETLHQQSFSALKAGAQQKVSGVIYLNDGTHILGVSIDDQNQVDETNEGNNKNRITVIIRNCGTAASSTEPRRQ